MTAEITLMQSQNEIAKLNEKVARLTTELELVQAKKANKLEDSLYSPKMFEHYQKVANMLAKTDMVPKNYKGKPGDVFVAMSMGYQLGLPVEQALQNIAVINGTPALWGDALIALALSHPACEGIDELPLLDDSGNITGYVCTVKRAGHAPHQARFTLQDAQRAGLLKKQGPWQQYTSRMLQLRARNFAVRDKFSDILKGLSVAEVVQDDQDYIEASAEKQAEYKTQTDKVKENIVSNDQEQESEQTLEDMHNEIQSIVEQEGFDQSRLEKALSYYQVEAIAELGVNDAKMVLKAFKQ